MSHWNRPMRGYRSAQLICDACGQRITGEVRMVGSRLYHVLCDPSARRSAAVEARLAERAARRKA